MKYILLFFALSILAFSASAQGPFKGDTIDLSAEGRAKYLTNKLAAEIELTQCQKDLIQLIYKDRSQKIDSVLATASINESQKKQRIKEIKDAAEAEIKGCLLNSQKEKYDAYKAEIKTVRQNEKQQGRLGSDAVDNLYQSDL